MSLSIVAVTVLLLVERTAHLRYYLATGATWALLFIVYSKNVFGTLFPPYFLSSHLQSGVLGVETLQSSYVEALAGTLISPGRGLFVYVPITAVILFAALRYRRSMPQKPLALAAIAVILAHWQLISASQIWWGGQSYGPRLFADVLPWFYLLAVLVIEGLGPAIRTTSRAERSALFAATALAAMLSLFINARGATARETIQWRGYSLWDWQHPQFLEPIPKPWIVGSRSIEYVDLDRARTGLDL